MTSLTADAAVLRRAIYTLLIVAACASAAGRILNVASDNGKTPFLSANDRSRWSAVRALVDHGTFALDDVIFLANGERNKDWHTIDLVKHRGWDGREHYYSSKPTLFTVALAGEYWLVKNLTGISLAENPLYIGRLMLLITNLLPLAAFLWLLSRLVERYGSTNLGRIVVMAAACFGTFLTTFAVTLNNHLPAAVTALATVYLALAIWRERDSYGWRYFGAGVFAALTVANELPALALLALVGAALLWKSPRQALVGFVPPVIVIAAAALGTNYWAHGSFKTPYAHRGDGPEIASVASTPELLEQLDQEQDLPEAIEVAIADAGLEFSGHIYVFHKTPGERWMLWNEPTQQRLSLVKAGEELSIREWDNWYDYEGTYWVEENKRGVDRGERSRLVYAFHCTFGHHGIFSLTPLWLFSLAGLWLLWKRPEAELRGLALATVLLMAVVLAFYILQRPLADRNYGGVSAGLRWMFWFIPLWLLALLPAADAVSERRWWWRLLVAALFVSVLSAHYASLDPWSHPWIYDYWYTLGWIDEY